MMECELDKQEGFRSSRAGSDWLTHIVVAVLDQKRNTFAIDVVPPGGLIQTVSNFADIAQQLPISEPAPAVRVDNGNRVRVMAGDSLEYRQSR